MLLCICSVQDLQLRIFQEFVPLLVVSCVFPTKSQSSFWLLAVIPSRLISYAEDMQLRGQQLVQMVNGVHFDIYCLTLMHCSFSIYILFIFHTHTNLKNSIKELRLTNLRSVDDPLWFKATATIHSFLSNQGSFKLRHSHFKLFCSSLSLLYISSSFCVNFLISSVHPAH